MTMTDPIADLLTRIRNINSLKRPRTKIPYSKIKEQIVDTLQREGYIDSYEVLTDEESGFKELLVRLKYGPDGEYVINKIERVSTPGRRLYRSITDLSPVIRGMGIWILSTSKGVLSDTEARKQNIGGEVLCKVY